VKTLFVVIGLVAVSTSAFADAGRPVRQGDKCWAITDSSRGFGYWDKCAAGHDLAQRNQLLGLNPRTPRAVTQVDTSDDGGAGGGAGGGGGGR
jgi:hypothetical protein